MTIGIGHIVGILITIALIAGVGMYSGRKVSDSADFTTGGGKAGMWLVCGAVMGSLVSGQATIGTAQLAFTYGLSAWWFTLGAGMGCIVLMIGYIIPLRHSGNVTLLQVISEEYGTRAEYLGSVLCSIGIFISVISQILAATALITTITPLNYIAAAVLAVIIMACYVIFGGAWGAGMGGIVKLMLLYMASVVGLCIVLVYDGGLSGIMNGINKAMVGTALGSSYGINSISAVNHRFINIIARGASKDIGSGISLLLGVIATQTYAQAIWTGNSDSAARKGALLSAMLTPPIGIACTFIGLFMRSRYITSEELSAIGGVLPTGMKEIENSSQVFSVFVVNYMPELLGGIVLGTLLITVVAGGAGLSLGVSTILVNDILKKISNKYNDARNNLIAIRATILMVLTFAAVVACLVPGAVINDFGFLSMGLRGAVVFLPLTCALFFKGKINECCIEVSILIGPAAVLVGKLLGVTYDPLFLGIAASAVICIIGAVIGQHDTNYKKDASVMQEE